MTMMKLKKKFKIKFKINGINIWLTGLRMAKKANKKYQN